jgi:hypothetical protein
MAKNKKPIDTNAVYRFCGNGTCIPGLPHEVSAREAELLGLLELLQAAIENGNYQAIQTKPAADTAGE